MTDSSDGRERSRSAATEDGDAFGGLPDMTKTDLARLLMGSADWLWETDAEQRVVWLSAEFEQATGIMPEQIIGRSRLSLRRDVVRANKRAEAHLDDVAARRPFSNFVYEFDPGASQRLWVSTSGFPRFDPGGAFVGYLGSARNLTGLLPSLEELTEATLQLERYRELERALEVAIAGESHAERLMAALNVMADAFCYYDADDRLVLFNEAFIGMYRGLQDVIVEGVRFEELIGHGLARDLWDIAPHTPDEWKAALLADRRSHGQSKTILKFRDGRYLMRREMGTKEGGRIGICTDITEMKRREAEIAAANEKTDSVLSDLKRTVDAMTMGVVVLDADLSAEIINRAFYDLWKVTSDQVAVGDPFRALMDVNRYNGVYDVEADKWEDYVESRLKELRAGEVAPREFHRADGRTMIYSVTPLSGGKRLVCYFDISDMKEREAALAEALEKSRLAEAVINGVKDPIFVKDSSLRFVFANDAFARIFDKTPADMLGRLGSDYVSREDAALFEQSERYVLATGERYEIQEDFELAGAGRSRIVRKNRVSMDSGKDYVACFIFDVTDIKRREVEAEEARQTLANVIESLPAGVVIYDRNDRFVLANEKITESLPALLSGMSKGAPLRDALACAHAAGYFRKSGIVATDALYDVDRDAWIDAYTERYHVKQAVFERQNPDGRWYQAFDCRTDDGTYIGVRVDITELKQREAALRASMSENEMFRNLIDNVPVAIYAKKADLELTYVNDGWCKLTGFSPEEAIGRTDVEIFGADGEIFAETDRDILRTSGMREIEETTTLADGRVRYQIARKRAMTASDGSLYLIGSTTDVTELKNRENELREARRKAELADRAKSEFLANMSHEIRTPMNGVLGMAELLAKSSLDAKQKTFTDIIVKSGNALLTIINDILDFSKIDAGQLVLDPAPFQLAEAIEDVATLVSTRAKEKDIELIVRVQPDLPCAVVGDVGRIRQIVTNLMGNAVKFTDSGHVLVEVTGAQTGSNVALRIAVTDTGIGIPEDKIALVFEKFSQVDASSTRRHEGTGLGLAISSRLVALMNGGIGVESKEGEGSSFWFEITLPVANAIKEPRVAPLDVTGARILIVDDNAVNRAILTEQMASWSFDACAAVSGAEGIAVLRAARALGRPVDCLILDYQMPGMNGAEVASLIRNTQGIADVPIVMLTSVDQSLSQTRHSDLGIDAQLIKPARSSALLDALVTTIQRHKSGKRDEVERHPGAPVQAASMPEAAHSARQAPEPVRRTPAPANGINRVDVLIAEDNEVNQLVFTQILEETGLAFAIVANGALAVEAARSLSPRMILMDVSMPEMNGMEATAAIRAHETGSGTHVPIVGVTAHALKGDRERCIEAGMDDYMSKPIKPNALVEKIDHWLSHPAVERRDAG